LLRARAHYDLIGINPPATGHGRELLGDTSTQLGYANVRRVAGHPMLNGLNPRLSCRCGRIEIGLANAEIQNILSGRLATLGFVADGDGFGSFQMLDVQRQWIRHAYSD
jgi:hypothetical protein